MDVRAQVVVGVPPRQVHRVPHLQRRLQEPVDRPAGRRVHVVEQRRDQARHRLPGPLGGPGGVRRRLGAEDGEAPAAAGRARAPRWSSLFHNPSLPALQDYYEPWTYDYERAVQRAAAGDDPAHRPPDLAHRRQAHRDPTRARTGTTTWAARGVYAANDPGLATLSDEERAQAAGGGAARLLLPAAHLQPLPQRRPAWRPARPAPSTSAARTGWCSSSQEKCRGWRMCVSACPYKKIYFNWADREVREVHPLLPAPGERRGPGLLPHLRRPDPLPGRAALRRRRGSGRPPRARTPSWWPRSAR